MSLRHVRAGLTPVRRYHFLLVEWFVWLLLLAAGIVVLAAIALAVPGLRWLG